MSSCRADRECLVTFLQTAFEPSDWIALFLKSYQNGQVGQRVGCVSWAPSQRCHSWLRAMNARKFNVYVSVNAIAPGRRTRTRDAIACSPTCIP